MKKFDMHWIAHNGCIWANLGDIISMLEDFGSTEPTDTRNRITELCLNLSKLGIKPYKESTPS